MNYGKPVGLTWFVTPTSREYSSTGTRRALRQMPVEKRFSAHRAIRATPMHQHSTIVGVLVNRTR